MIYLNNTVCQHYPPPALAGAVRQALGKPLRRAAPLTQLALLGALASLPPDRRQRPSALLWQSTSGPRQETLSLLNEICLASGEPMPYDFLATQPAIAAAQIQPFLPGLQSAMHFPLDTEGQANWSLLLNLACNWLNEERYEQVLCAHLDSWENACDGYWLTLSRAPLENSLASLQLSKNAAQNTLLDTPDFPQNLANWLQQATPDVQHMLSPAAFGPALEFARL